GPMFCWYLRNTYLENKLRQPGATVQGGVPVDLGAIEAPTFVYASKEDHIVPWTTAYTSTQLLSGADTRFVLGASGHIAGVINPPAKKKRNYWTAPQDADSEPADAAPEAWLAAAESIPGSWWPAWIEWLSPRSGPEVDAPAQPGNVEF